MPDISSQFGVLDVLPVSSSLVKLHTKLYLVLIKNDGRHLIIFFLFLAIEKPTKHFAFGIFKNPNLVRMTKCRKWKGGKIILVKKYAS